MKRNDEIVVPIFTGTVHDLHGVAKGRGAQDYSRLVRDLVAQVAGNGEFAVKALRAYTEPTRGLSTTGVTFRGDDFHSLVKISESLADGHHGSVVARVVAMAAKCEL